MTNPTLFSGEYIEDVLKEAEKIENRETKKVFCFIAFGVSKKRKLSRFFDYKTVGKTCQYLVDNKFVEEPEVGYFRLPLGVYTLSYVLVNKHSLKSYPSIYHWLIF